MVKLFFRTSVQILYSTNVKRSFTAIYAFPANLLSVFAIFWHRVHLPDIYFRRYARSFIGNVTLCSPRSPLSQLFHHPTCTSLPSSVASPPFLFPPWKPTSTSNLFASAYTHVDRSIFPMVFVALSTTKSPFLSHFRTVLLYRDF